MGRELRGETWAERKDAIAVNVIVAVASLVLVVAVVLLVVLKVPWPYVLLVPVAGAIVLVALDVMRRLARDRRT